MQKIIWFLFPIFFVACSNSSLMERRSNVQSFLEEENRLKVLSTTEMIRDLVQQIGGDKVHSIALISKNLDPHSYELVKGDDELLASCDCIFSNGLGLEHGASLSSYLKQSSKNFSVANFLLEHHKEKLLFVEGVVDPHVWMDIKLWSELIDPIVGQLISFDPENAEIFEKNGQHLKEKLLQEHYELLSYLQAIPEKKRYIVTSHDAFNYFTKTYLAKTGEKDWKKRFMAPEGLSPEMQLSIVDIQKIVDHLEEFNIKVIFAESGVSQDSIRKVLHAAKKKNMDIRIAENALFADSLISGQSDYSSYLETMRHNAQTLYQCLHEEE